MKGRERMRAREEKGRELDFSKSTSVGEVAVIRAARAPRGVEPLCTVSHDELWFKIS